MVLDGLRAYRKFVIDLAVMLIGKDLLCKCVVIVQLHMIMFATAQAPSTGNSRMDIAYRCYGKRHGEEALLAWKRKKKRIAATVKLIESGKDPAYNAKHLQFISKLEQKEDLLPYPDCYVPDCGAESLPHSGYCYKRILFNIYEI